MLEISLLGIPALAIDGSAVQISRRKSRALVYFVAAHERPVAREQLLELLWPDLEPTAARQTLRTTLHGLRRALGPALVVSDASVALANNTVVDARRLAAAVADPGIDPASLAAALEHYRGEFLAGFDFVDALPFEAWLIGERERYRGLAIRGWTRLARLREQQGDYAAALAALERALAFDPLQEDLERDAMRLHYLAGDRVGAIRRYEQLRERLDAELGVPPMAATRALYDAVITDTLPAQAPAQPSARASAKVPPPARSPATLPFTGRNSELARLHELTAGGSFALIEGEPGIGKTRLAEEFLQSSGALVLSGTAYELEQAIPYHPVIEALRSLATRPDWPALQTQIDLAPVWLGEVARLAPALAPALALQPALAQPNESRLWEGVSRFLHTLGRRQQVVFFIDDLHWADTATLGLLSYLVRQVADGRVFFLATARPVTPREPLAALLQTLTRAGRLARLPLDRLDADATTDLAHHLSPTYAYPLAEWLLRSAEGNPYILAELVRYARDHAVLQADGTLNLTALTAAPVIPQGVYSLIQSRLAQLSEAARRMLDAAVAVGREFEFDIAVRAAALSETAALDALDELRAAGLVVPLADGLRYAFNHTLTMEVAYREVGEPRHRLLHRRVAEALVQGHGSVTDEVAGLIAFHFAEGGAPERAAPYARRAGELAAGLAAWKEAATFYEQALSGIRDSERGDLLLALGDAQLRAGAAVRAAETFQAAIAHEPDGGSLRSDAAQLALTRALLPQGRFGEMIDLARTVVRHGNPASQAGAEFMWGTALSLEGADLAAAARHLRRAEQLLAACPQQTIPVIPAQIRFELGSIAAQQGDLTRAVALYREAQALAAGDSDQSALEWNILAHNNLAYHLHLLSDPAAEQYAREGLRLAQEHGALGLLPYLWSSWGEIALAQGNLDAAEQRFSSGLQLAEQLAIPERIAGLTANLGLVAQQRGETARAIHRLATALAQADALGTRQLATQIRIWLAPLLPSDEAQTRLAEARAIAASSGRQRLLAEIAQVETTLQGG